MRSRHDHLDAYPDTSFRGQVRQVVPTADRQRATVQVKVAIIDHDSRILPEMGARVDFLDPTRCRCARPAAPRRSGCLRPQCARSTARRSYGWFGTDGWSRERCEAGPVSGGFRESGRGLSGGELLLTGGVEAPKRGCG